MGDSIFVLDQKTEAGMTSLRNKSQNLTSVKRAIPSRNTVDESSFLRVAK